MSFRSGSNTDLVLNNLKVNGTLTLANELEIANLEVAGDTSLNTLEVHGDAEMLEDLKVVGNSILTTLQVNGESILTDLEVTNDTTLSDVAVQGHTNLNTLDIGGTANFDGESNMTYLAVTNELNILGNVFANNETITPIELGCISGVVSNIQDQLDAKVDTNNPTFSGTATMPTTKTNGYTYIGNDGSALPTYNLSNYFGAIGSNMSKGDGELDFINTGYQATNASLSAFDWYMMTSTSTISLLMRLYHNGGLMVNGLLNAVGGVTTSTLTATGTSQLANVNVSGNLNVTGQITSSAPSNMEILYYKLQGNAASVTQTMTLLKNASSTTNYSVFPSLYYGFSGSGGTYDANGTSACRPRVAGGRTRCAEIRSPPAAPRRAPASFPWRRSRLRLAG